MINFKSFEKICDQNNIHTKIIEILLDLKITNYWIQKLMKIFSQFSICYLTHIILNKWKLWENKHWFHYTNYWIPHISKYKFITLHMVHLLKMGIKPPLLHVHTDMYRRTDIACQCKNTLTFFLSCDRNIRCRCITFTKITMCMKLDHVHNKSCSPHL